MKGNMLTIIGLFLCCHHTAAQCAQIAPLVKRFKLSAPCSTLVSDVWEPYYVQLKFGRIRDSLTHYLGDLNTKKILGMVATDSFKNQKILCIMKGATFMQKDSFRHEEEPKCGAKGRILKFSRPIVFDGYCLIQTIIDNGGGADDIQSVAAGEKWEYMDN